METFVSQPGFCPTCGTILPPLTITGNISCYNCKNEFSPEVYGEQETEYTINFNTFDEGKFAQNAKVDPDEADGPIVDRICSKCGHDKMSYATIQLRSADEGQTVFFTCAKCKFKESENS